jgi:RNA polymerase sigma factor (sigma-70 family)
VRTITRTAPQPTPPEHLPQPVAGENLAALWQAVFRRALYLTGNRTTAEDAAQETFVRYLANRPAGLASPLAWLITVCTRVCFDWGRKQRRSAAAPLEQAGERVADPGLLPDELLTGQEEVRMARQALEQLDSRDRMILLLRYSATPYREIAAAAGCAESSVGQLLHRAERRFKAAYEQLAESGPPR